MYLLLCVELSDLVEAAVQDFAQLVERVGADVSIFAQTVELAAAEAVLVNELVLRNVPVFHGKPKSVKYDQAAHSFKNDE